MMNFSGICLVTECIPELVQFYGRILDCQAEGNDHHAEFTLDGLSLTIFTRHGMGEMARGSMRGAGHVHFTISCEVEDAGEQFERLKELGVVFVKLPVT